MAEKSRTFLALLCLVAVGVMAYGQYLIRLDPNDNVATAIFLAAALAVALLLRAEGPWPGIESGPFEPGRRWRTWLGVLLVLVGLAVVGAGSTLLTLNFQLWVNQGWGLVIAGTSLATLGFYGLDPKGHVLPRWTRNECVVLLVTFAVGMFLRYYRYTDFPQPYTMHAIEEPQAGMRAHFLLKGIYYWEFIFDNYITAASMWLFGDRSIVIIRIPHTLASALTVFPLYVLLRQVVGKPAAHVGTFLWAVSAWNVIYSRCAHNIFSPNLLVVVAFALWFRLGRTHRLAALPWAALLSAFTLYNYAAYRGTSVLALVLLGVVLLMDLWAWRKATDPAERRLRRVFALRIVGSIVMLFAFIFAMAAPIYKQVAYNTAQPGYYFEAANRSLSNKEYYTSDTTRFIEQRLKRMREASRIFMHKGDSSDTFNEPNEPMLDPIASVAFVGGIFLCLVYPRRRFHLWILLGFLFMMFGGTVFVQNLDVRRLQGVTPFVMMLAALFFDRLLLLGQRLPRRVYVILGVIAAVVGGCFSTYWSYNVYFNKMAKNRFVRQAFHSRYLTIVHYGRTAGAGRYTVLLSDIRHFFHPSDFYWLVEDIIPGREMTDVLELIPPNALAKTSLPINVVVQSPYEQVEIARLLKQVYPGTECSDFIEPENPYIALKVCSLPRDPQPRPLSMRLTARYYQGAEATGKPVIERQEPFIGYGTYPPNCYGVLNRQAACVVEWSGTMKVAEAGTYQFSLRTREAAKLEVKIDGRPVTDKMELAAGDHHVTAHATIPRDTDTGVRFEWQTPDGPEAVPFYDVGTEAAAPPAEVPAP